MKVIVIVGLMVLGHLAMVLNPSSVFAQDSGSQAVVNGSDQSSMKKWIALKDRWGVSEFGGEGEVSIKDGVITMDYGEPLTGVKWEGSFEGDKDQAATEGGKDSKATPILPRDNYELRWECRRDDGYDFLCAFTFPVAKSHASFVLGGWGGGITGISSIDGQDASDNATTAFLAFENDQWYKARVRVAADKITAWIDGKQVLEHPRADHEFDIRFEMDPCTPLGIANYECISTIRKVEIRRLEGSEFAKKDSDLPTEK